MRRPEVPIEGVRASAFVVPTEAPESDGTFQWDSTTLVLVEASAGGATGLGYSYADRATCTLIVDRLASIVQRLDALDVNACWQAMVDAIRNLGRPGIASMAIAAVDNALWDLKARLLDLPLTRLLGSVRPAVPVYGSGGFTSLTDEELADRLATWVEDGIPRVKMKVGREPARDPERVRVARDAIGPEAELFVDANGAYDRKQSLRLAEVFAARGVTWFEEPVTSDDLESLRLIRDRAPSAMEITAGEYGYDLDYFRRMCAAGAVDVLQADATRCAGITGFIKAAVIAESFHVPLSSHCAPSIHAHPCCSLQGVRHLEYFHDHVRLEHLLFDGALEPRDGAIAPALDRPGHGLVFKHADAARYAIR